MGTDKKIQIRIIKQGMAGSIPELQAVSGDTQKEAPTFLVSGQWTCES